MATEPEQIGGPIRAALDPKLLQVRGDGAVVYVEDVGDGSQRPSRSVLDSDQESSALRSRRCTGRGAGLESRPVSSEGTVAAVEK